MPTPMGEQGRMQVSALRGIAAGIVQYEWAQGLYAAIIGLANTLDEYLKDEVDGEDPIDRTGEVVGSFNFGDSVFEFTHINDEGNIEGYIGDELIIILRADFLAGFVARTIYGEYAGTIWSEIMHDELVTNTVTEIYGEDGQPTGESLDISSLILDLSRPVLRYGEGPDFDLLIPVLSRDGSVSMYILRAALDQAMIHNIPLWDELNEMQENGLSDHIDNIEGGGFDPLTPVNSPHDLITNLDLELLRTYVSTQYAGEIARDVQVFKPMGFDESTITNWYIYREQNRWNLDIWAVQQIYTQQGEGFELPAWILKSILIRESHMNPNPSRRPAVGMGQIERDVDPDEPGEQNVLQDYGFNQQSFRAYTLNDVDGYATTFYDHIDEGRNAIDASAAVLLYYRGYTRSQYNSLWETLTPEEQSEVIDTTDTESIQLWDNLTPTQTWQLTVAAYNRGIGTIPRAANTVYTDDNRIIPDHQPPTFNELITWALAHENEGRFLFGDHAARKYVQNYVNSIWDGEPARRGDY